jgi:hypothetical protein
LSDVKEIVLMAKTVKKDHVDEIFHLWGHRTTVVFYKHFVTPTMASAKNVYAANKM